MLAYLMFFFVSVFAIKFTWLIQVYTTTGTCKVVTKGRHVRALISMSFRWDGNVSDSSAGFSMVTSSWGECLLSLAFGIDISDSLLFLSFTSTGVTDCTSCKRPSTVLFFNTMSCFVSFVTSISTLLDFPAFIVSKVLAI